MDGRKNRKSDILYNVFLVPVAVNISVTDSVTVTYQMLALFSCCGDWLCSQAHCFAGSLHCCCGVLSTGEPIYKIPFEICPKVNC